MDCKVLKSKTLFTTQKSFTKGRTGFNSVSQSSMFLLSREHHTFEETFTFFHWRGEAGLKHCLAAHAMAQLWPLPGHPWTQGRDRTGHSLWNWGNSWVLDREQSFKRTDSAAWLAQIWLKNITLRLDTGVWSHIHTAESSPEGWEVPWDTCKIKHILFLVPSIPCSTRSVWTDFPIGLLF